MAMVPSTITSGGNGGVIGGRPAAGATNVATRSTAPINAAAPEDAASYETSTLTYQDYVKAPQSSQSSSTGSRAATLTNSRDVLASYGALVGDVADSGTSKAQATTIERGLEGKVTGRYEKSAQSSGSGIDGNGRGQVLDVRL